MAILEAEEEEFYDWSTYQIVVNTVRPRKTVSVPRNGDGVSLGNGVMLRPHPHLEAQVRLTTLKLASKHLGESTLSPILQENSLLSQPFVFTSSQGGSSKLNVLQLKDVNVNTIKTVTNEAPIILKVNKSLLETEEYILAIGYDGDFFLPLGFGTANVNTFTTPQSELYNTQILLQKLPKVISNDGESLQDNIYIFFHKFINKPIRESFDLPILTVAKVADNDIITYEENTDTIKQQVTASNTIILYINDEIISDAKSILASVQQAKLEVDGQQKSIAEIYDLVLAFNYEVLNTAIENQATILKGKLEAVGLGTNHGKVLHVIAHSTGGLLARWFIEREGGNKIVQHLIMLGTPNAGSPFPIIKESATLALAIGLNSFNQIPWDERILPNLTLLSNLDTKKENFALNQIQTGSPFLNALADSFDPGIPYTIIAGNSSIIPAALEPQEEGTTPIQKLAQSLFGAEFNVDLPFFAQPNDLIATVESIKSIPQGRFPQPNFIEVNCDHFSYFSSPEGLNALAKALEQKENKQPTPHFQVVHKIEGHKGGVSSVKFSPDGQMIASAGADKLIKIWSLDGTCVATLQGHEGRVIEVAFSPDGQYLVSGGDDNTVRLWSLQDNQMSPPFIGHETNVNSVAFSPDGQMIASGGWDGTVRLWDLQGNLISSQFVSESNNINSVAFSPNAQDIVASSLEGNVIRLILVTDSKDTAFAENKFNAHERAVNSVTFSPDGKLIASGSDDNTIRLWNWNGTAIGQPFKGHENSVRSVTFSPDGLFLVSGSRDNTIRLWNLQGNQIGEPLRIHTDSVTSVAISSDGQMILSGSNDGTICLWEQKQPSELNESPEVVKTYTFYPTLETLSPELSVGENFTLPLNLRATPQPGIEPLRIPVNTLEITIYIEAAGFYLRGEHTRTLAVQKGKLMESSLNLQLTPLISGDHNIYISVYPGGKLPNLNPVKLKKEIHINKLRVLPNMRELLDRRAIPDPQPQIIIHATLEDVAGEQTTRQQKVGLYLTCAALKLDREFVEYLQFSANELERLRQFIIQQLVVANGSPADNVATLRAIGEMLFDKLIPPESRFREYFWQLILLANTSSTPLSLLIVSEPKAILPWELVCVSYPLEKGEICYEFLGEKFILGHWVGSQGLKLENEAPLGELSLTHYNQLPEEHLWRWQEVLSRETRFSKNSGLLELMRLGSRCYGLHVLRYTDTQQTGQITSYKPNQEALSGKTLTQAEELLYNQQLDFTLRRPVVGLSLVDGQPQGTAISMSKSDNQLEKDWIMPLLYAGASALVGTRWTVLPEADQLFFSTFYHQINLGTELGWAVWRAREEVRVVFPHRCDWLAYTYFGHPKCEPYLIRESQGFTFFEAINPPPNDCFEAGKSYQFRASYRTEAPVWYKGRLHAAPNFIMKENITVTVLSTRGIPPETHQLEPVENGDSYQCIITLTMPKKVTKKLPVIVNFQKGDEELRNLMLNFKVIAGGE